MRLPRRDEWEVEREYLSVLELAKELEKLTSQVTGAIDRVGVEYFNVRDYPGATGQESIQAAIDAANAAGGGTVFMPRGTYSVSGTILMKSFVDLIGEGYGSVIQVSEGFADNILKFENIEKASARYFRIDGNRANVTGNQYGFFFGGSNDCRLVEVWAHGCRGDGIHFYDCDGCQVALVHSWDNLFHGMEIEQCRDFQSLGGTFFENDVNGIYIFEGEVGATGSHRVLVSDPVCVDNGFYGIAIQGPLSDDITITAPDCAGNESYGITIFDRTKNVVIQGGNVSLNGDHGIYMWRTTQARITDVTFRRNSQSSNGSFQEVFLEGDATQYTLNNKIEGNAVIMDGATKAAYGVKENSVNDGPNIIRNNIVPFSGTVGTIAVLHPDSFGLCRGNIGRVSENGGTETQDTDGIATQYFWPHGLSIDEPRKAWAVPGNQVSAAEHWVTWDATNIYVDFSAAPTAGTGFFVFHWKAEH